MAKIELKRDSLSMLSWMTLAYLPMIWVAFSLSAIYLEDMHRLVLTGCGIVLAIASCLGFSEIRKDFEKRNQASS